MERSIKSLSMVLLIWVAFLLPILGATEEIKTPEQLIAEFYRHLLSEEPTSQLPQIFSEPTTFASALKLPNLEGVQDKAKATEMVWNYFRENKKLFLFSKLDPLKPIKKARLNYVFMAFQNPATFFDGIFCVELIAPLSEGGKEGVYKQIRFPLEKNTGPTGPRYLIQETAITVNGILIDLTGESNRTGNLYQQLGVITP